MKIAIVYDEKRLNDNLFFAQQLKKELNADICFENNDLTKYDALVFRTENYLLREKAEKVGKFVFNSSFLGKIANDKTLTYEWVKTLGIEYLSYTYSKIDQLENCKFPLIIKSPFGHGGKEVFMVKSIEEGKQVFQKLGEERLILQEPSKELGRDIRVYVLGKKILACVERKNEHSFKSNYTLGGTCRFTTITKEIQKAVDKIIDTIPIGLIGIDFIMDNDKGIFNEIEDIVGTRMLYSKGMNAAKIYSDYIKEKINE